MKKEIKEKIVKKITEMMADEKEQLGIAVDDVELGMIKREVDKISPYLFVAIEEMAKEMKEELEKKFSVKQFGEEFINLSKKYPKQIHYLKVAIIEWEEFWKEFKK